MHYLGKCVPQPSLGQSLRPILPQDFDRFDQKSNYASTGHAPGDRHHNAADQTRTRGTFNPNKSDTAMRLSQIHPEGSQVHCRGQLVSDNVPSTNLLNVGEQILEQYNSLSLTDVTVFLRHKGETIEYYVADHQAKTVSWADNQRHASLSGLAPNREHNLLKEEYWTHMENFPGVRCVDGSCVEDLKDVLASLAVDSGTSDGSTSPFSTKQITMFLNCLNSLGHKSNEYKTYMVARLWNMIWHARAVNSFGGLDACLDRFVVLTEQSDAFTGQNMTLAKLSFGAADTHLARCRRTWAGRIAYVTEWRNFKAKNEKEWTQVTQLACVLVLASLLVFDKHKLHYLKVISTSMAAGSAANGYYLTSESQNLGENASDAAVYFQKWESPSRGVQHLAIRNAAPQTLLIWAALCFVLSILATALPG